MEFRFVTGTVSESRLPWVTGTVGGGAGNTFLTAYDSSDDTTLNSGNGKHDAVCDHIAKGNMSCVIKAILLENAARRQKDKKKAE